MRSTDVRPLIPIEAKPPKPLDDAVDHGPGGALGVGILDAEDEGPALPARVEPVEERRARAADVQIAGWRRGEADADPLIVMYRGSTARRFWLS